MCGKAIGGGKFWSPCGVHSGVVVVVLLLLLVGEQKRKISTHQVGLILQGLEKLLNTTN